jgi:hypothetical protein
MRLVLTPIISVKWKEEKYNIGHKKVLSTKLVALKRVRVLLKEYVW